VDEAVEPVASARLFLNDQATRVENVEPYALFGDTEGDFRGGLSLQEDDAIEVGIDFYAEPRAVGERVATLASTITTAAGVLDSGRDGAADIYALDETKIGATGVTSFDELDTLALFGGTAATAAEVIALAEVKDGDTIIDVGDGNILTLSGYSDLSADDVSIL
jgi:hypothetical protein